MGCSITNNGLEVVIDGQTPETWTAILSQFADASIYQTWAYGAVRWGTRQLSHFALRRNGEVLAAAQLRIVRVPLLATGIAYMRWGPMCQLKGKVLDPTLLPITLAQLRKEYSERRGLVLQIIPNAFIGTERGEVFQSAFQQYGFDPEQALGQYRTVIVDLTNAPDLLRRQLDQKWRNQLNRSEKNGLSFEVNEQAEAYREFNQLYQGMLLRKQFETSVNVVEFSQIQTELLADTKMHIFLARKDGEAIAALVCSLLGDTAIYLLGATNEKARDLKAAYFLHWQAMLWLKQQGALKYDLGGIDPEANPGGYHFKSGFGGSDTTMSVSRVLSCTALSKLICAFLSLKRSRTRQ